MFKLAAISESSLIEVSERSESLIFIGTAVVGLLSSYLALGLIQKQSDVNRRLVLKEDAGHPVPCSKSDEGRSHYLFRSHGGDDDSGALTNPRRFLDRKAHVQTATTRPYPSCEPIFSK